MGIDQLLTDARRRLTRLTPGEAHRAMARGALLIDIRSETQIRTDGTVPGASFVPRNVLEWRLDPSCAWRDPELARTDAVLIVMCDEGYQSSLAAATLQQLGLRRVTDLIGGFQAWRTAGLPVQQPGGQDEPARHRGGPTEPRKPSKPSPTGNVFRLHGH